MHAPTFFPASRYCRPLAVLGLLTLLAACAQPQESAIRYDTSRENTQRDAESSAMGTGPRAASQIQLGFGNTGAPPTPAAGQPAAADDSAAQAGTPGTRAGTPATPRPLAEARSFLGTVPCPTGITCEAARFMVTLAPSGEWRARTVLLVSNQPTQTLVDQGCWQVIGDHPLRIALMNANQETSMGDFSFVNDNTLRVHTLNGVQPMLEHRLTRQADIDPIDELQGRPQLNCS